MLCHYPRQFFHLLLNACVRRHSELAQGTAEYALILVAVTAMVGVVIAYVSGDGGGMITQLFGAAFAKMRSLVGG